MEKTAAPYIIATERLGLRRWIANDFTPFANMNKDADLMKYFPSVLTDDETAAMKRVGLPGSLSSKQG